MEVVRDNFADILPEALRAIDEADFVAVDLELTGLHSSAAESPGFLDSLDEYYGKALRSAQRFGVSQYGVCPIKWDPQQSAYIARPYNFNVFHRAIDDVDVRYTMQSSSLEYLARYRFDFNKWVYQGIPFLSPSEEEAVRRKRQLESTANGATPKRSSIVVDGDNAAFIRAIYEQIDAFLAADPAPDHLDLAPTNAFQRRLVYEQCEARYGTNATIHLASTSSTDAPHARFIRVTRMNDEQRAAIVAERAKAEAVVGEYVGFRKVIDHLSKSRKPVIGHNMFLDVLHTHSKFFSTRFPPTASEFMDLLLQHFGAIFDTKLLLLAPPVAAVWGAGNTHLSSAVARIKEAPFDVTAVRLAPGFDRYTDGSDSFHEAGFDAYCTGALFASLLHFLGDGGATPAEAAMNSAALAPYRNRVHLFRHYGVICGGGGPRSSDDVLHIAGFPAAWQTADLNALLQPFADAVIQWIDETSCFASVLRWAEGGSREALQARAAAEVPGIDITPAAEHVARTAAARAERADQAAARAAAAAASATETPVKRPRVHE